ncbi:MAG: isoaspartyl peptidase/L-asparaginase family protein [Anaerolineae bacterium]
MSLPVILVHGGAWYIPESEREEHVAGCRRAALAAWEKLLSGASALDAVELAVRLLEDNPSYDAGRGSYRNKEGRVQLDAIIVDGRTLDFGAVAAVERVSNPISLARLVMERSEHRFVVGQGAEALAASFGMQLCGSEELEGKLDDGQWSPPVPAQSVSWPSVARPGDTVGALALDVDGHLAAATSTGGTPDKWPGRVGDSPLIGCGAYADDTAGAAAATGAGEYLMRIVTSKTAVDFMAGGASAQQAAEAVVARLWERVRGFGGVILIDRNGGVGLAHNTPNLAYAYVVAEGPVVAGTEVSSREIPGRAEGLAAVRGDGSTAGR